MSLNWFGEINLILISRILIVTVTGSAGGGDAVVSALIGLTLF